jgi:hypothetical protein
MFKLTFGKLAVAGLLLLTVIGGTVATASAQGTHPGSGAAHPAARAAAREKARQFLKDEFALIAKTIGVAEADLKTALQGGQTVAQVAQAHSVAPQTVIDAVVNDITAKAQTRPGWAKLSDTQKANFTTQARERVTNWVNGTAKTK